MMAIGFLGYVHSPKLFKYIYENNKISNVSIKNFSSFPKRESKRYYSTFNSNNDKDSITKVVQDFLTDKNLNPVFIYENLKDQDVKDKIKDQTKNLSGVYLILNRVKPTDYYIGSASTNKFHTRFYRHLINLTGSQIVKLAVRKYGLDNFAFIILELFPEEVNRENNKKLLDLEDFYLKSLLPNYNILTEAGSSFGYKHTEIDRIKMKANYSEERRERIGNLNKGKSLGELTKNSGSRMKKSALSRSTRNFSEEALLNMKKRSKSIILYNIDNNTVFGEYSSIVEAANSINCDQKTIRRCLKTEKKILLRR